MKILIVSDLYPPISVGGIQSAASNLVKSLLIRGHQIILLTSGEKEVIIRKPNLKIYYFSCIRLPSYNQSPVAIASRKKITQIFDKEKVDLVHIEVAYTMGATCLKEAKKRGLPVVFSFHALPANALSLLHKLKPLSKGYTWSFWKVMGFFIKQADCVTVPSQYGLTLLSTHYNLNHFQAISNGIDLKAFKREYSKNQALKKLHLEGKKVVLYVGRLSHEKSPETLIWAAAKIIKKQPNLHFVLAGEGSKLEDLKKSVSKLKLEGYVELPGFASEDRLKLLYHAASLFVMPSGEELQGIAVLEAMAYSLPIIVASAKALPELIEEGKNGFTFKPHNHADLAKKISLLVNDAAISKYGKNSYQKVVKHDINQTVSSYQSLYQKLIAQKASLTKLKKKTLKIPLSIMVGIPGYRC